jgi:protoheme IX farnesyltransferase
MLPVVATAQRVARQIVIYSWVMVAWTLLLVPVTGWLYVCFAVAAGIWFLTYAHKLHVTVRRGENGNPIKLFHLSNSYLTVIFVVLAVDSALGLPVIGLP